MKTCNECGQPLDTFADFWNRCVEAGCVVIPVRIYSDWGADGNTDEAKREGIGFIAFDYDQDVVGPDYYFQIEEGRTGRPVHETPEEAFEAFIAESA